jgi:hypothetical protein
VRRLGGPTVPGRRPWEERSKCGLQVSWLEPVTGAGTALPPVGHLSENSPVPGQNIAGYRALWGVEYDPVESGCDERVLALCSDPVHSHASPTPRHDASFTRQRPVGPESWNLWRSARRPPELPITG